MKKPRNAGLFHGLLAAILMGIIRAIHKHLFNPPPVQSSQLLSIHLAMGHLY
jgi:hypothetical protein